MATDTAAAPADQVDLSRNDAVFSKGLDDLLLQLLLRDLARAVIIRAPIPTARGFDFFNGDAGFLQLGVVLLGQLYALPCERTFTACATFSSQPEPRAVPFN